jgi:hypothetical protein
VDVLAIAQHNISVQWLHEHSKSKFSAANHATRLQFERRVAANRSLDDAPFFLAGEVSCCSAARALIACFRFIFSLLAPRKQFEKVRQCKNTGDWIKLK